MYFQSYGNLYFFEKQSIAKFCFESLNQVFEWCTRNVLGLKTMLMHYFLTYVPFYFWLWPFAIVSSLVKKKKILRAMKRGPTRKYTNFEQNTFCKRQTSRNLVPKYWFKYLFFVLGFLKIGFWRPMKCVLRDWNR